MSRFVIGEASAADDAELCELMRSTTMPGTVEFAFETEPSVFRAIGVQGRHAQVLKVCDSETGRIVACGVRAVRPLYVDGSVTDVGYLSGLRIHPAYRGGSLLMRIYRTVRDADEANDAPAPFYLTTILTENLAARRLLESARAGLPRYDHLGDLTTWIVPPQANRGLPQVECVSGERLGTGAILRFIERHGPARRFFPCLRPGEWGGRLYPDLHAKDFFGVLHNGTLSGVAALWDQRAFKQIRVTHYDWRLRWTRSLFNSFSRWTGMPRLPRLGERVNQGCLAFAVTRDNDSQSWLDLIAAALQLPGAKQFDYLSLGLATRDPRNAVMQKLRALRLASRVYCVTFSGRPVVPKRWRRENFFLETATL